jgi:hypothetical protein
VGRPKGFAGLAKYVQSLVGGGKDLADWVDAVWRGEIKPTEAQVKAHNWLTERGFGKAMQSIELQTSINRETGQVEASIPFDRLSLEEAMEYRRLVAKMSGREQPTIQARLTDETQAADAKRAAVEAVVEKVVEVATREEEGDAGDEGGEDGGD